MITMPYESTEDKIAYIKARLTISDVNNYNGTPCWEWTKGLNLGYGRYSIKGKNILAHRELYQLLIRELNSEEILDHLCRNRKCCNPNHLDVTSLVENCRRGNSYGNGGKHQKAKTHCPQGHEYNQENTKIISAGNGRRCLKCKRAQNSAYKKRKRQVVSYA